MSIATVLGKIKDLYSENLKANGIISTAVGWNTPESQNLRFEKLTSIISDRSALVTVNDYGCGYGAHLRYLERAGIRVAEYNGYDLSDPMLDAARTNLGDFTGELNLVCSSEISTLSDYSFVSGTFNVRFGFGDAPWKAFIQSKLDDLNRFSRRGFAFNLLSTYVDWQEPHLFYGDPCYWFDHCKRNYSKRVSLLHDYPLYEWTLVVRKDGK
ncbi:MAG: hypothetical protein JW384_04142 [Nitrosomonadaceae bacterium]|nr:hypothetical protein [Nitrosomonadaceae bacterium]